MRQHNELLVQGSVAVLAAFNLRFYIKPQQGKVQFMWPGSCCERARYPVIFNRHGQIPRLPVAGPWI